MPEQSYLTSDDDRQARGEPPQAAPIYPISPADERNRAVRNGWRSQRVAPTLPHVQFPGQSVADADPESRGGGRNSPGQTSEDALADLRAYPQTINAEYLGPMSAVIEEAIAAGDMSAIADYAQCIAQEQGVGLAKKAYAAMGDITPHPATITGSATTDGSPADGETENVVHFTVKDQNGQALANQSLTTATVSGAATVTATDPATDASGGADVTVTDDTAEAVTVTLTIGSVLGTASTTFVAVEPPPELDDSRRDSDDDSRRSDDDARDDARD